MMWKLAVCAASFAGLVNGLGPARAQPPKAPAIGEKVDKLPPNAIVVTEEQAAAIRSPSPEVLAAMEELEKKAPERGGNGRGVKLAETALASQLAWRIARDQYWRTAGLFEMRSFENEGDRLALGNLIAERMNEIDGENTAWLKGVIAEHGGWPKISEVGSSASGSLWLLAQHADRDPAFQKEVLALFEPLVAEGEVSRSNYAYLHDRVAVAEGRPQRYGTQGYCVQGEGRWTPREIENSELVDDIRAEAGLMPIADYIAQFTKNRACQ